MTETKEQARERRHAAFLKSDAERPFLDFERAFYSGWTQGAATGAACEALLRRLLAGNGWIVSHDAPTGRSTLVFGAITDDALGDTSIGNALAHAHGLLFPKGVPGDS